MRRLRRYRLLAGPPLSLCLLLLFGCSGDGEGEFNLDTVVAADLSQTLLVQVEGEIAALELDIPYDPDRTDSSTISVSLVENDQTPTDTYVDFSVKEGGWVKVGVLNGGENGLNGKPFELKVAYSTLGSDPYRRRFQEEATVFKALDTRFQSQKDKVTCRWVEE